MDIDKNSAAGLEKSGWLEKILLPARMQKAGAKVSLSRLLVCH
jgi:hypothetical protein